MIIAVINHKGGVGKTTTVANLGAGLASLGGSVLLVDADPQAHLTYSLGFAAADLDLTLNELLTDQAAFDRVRIEREGGDLVPASPRLAAFEGEASVRPGAHRVLADHLAGVSGYDWVLVDCPPNLGLLTRSAMTAADEILVPMQPEFLALQSLSALLGTIEEVRTSDNPDLKLAGVVMVRDSRRKKLGREVVGTIREHLGADALLGRIRENVSLAEAPSFGQDIFSYRPSSHGAQDYLDLAKTVAKRS